MQTQVFTRILATVPLIDIKNLQSAKKRTGNAVKPVSKQENTRLCLYLGNVTSGRRKITCKVLKNKRRMSLNWFQSRQTLVFAHIVSLVSPIDAK